MSKEFDCSDFRSIEPDLSTINVLKTEILSRKRLAADSPKDIELPIDISSKRLRFPNTVSDSDKKVLEESKNFFHKLAVDESESFDQSYQCLLKKSALYDKLTNGEVPPLADEDNPFLVDFEKKYYDKKLEATYGNVKPVNENGETYVEFVDGLGRTRRCKTSELQSLDDLSAPKTASFKDACLLPESFSNDAYRDKLRAKWQEELAEVSGNKDVHYQNIKFDEARDLGVGYFEFSKDESMRKQQMQFLQEMRNSTLKERMNAAVFEANQKVKNSDRLSRVCKNRGISLPTEDVRNEIVVSECLEEIILGVEKVSFADSSEKGTKGTALPAKSKFFDYAFKKPANEDFVEKLRNERNWEFAPPK